MIYLDNAATSFPKPAECLRRALDRYLALGASPGRGGYDRAVEAEAEVQAVRDNIARFFGAPTGARVCFAANATDALNTLILGLLGSGDHVVTTRLEHNSVLRPLNHLEKSMGIGIDHVPFDTNGFVDPARIEAAIKPQTRAVIVNHASNVFGTVQPVPAIGAICKARGIPLIVDVSQSAGCIPIQMETWDISGLAFTGHKSLLGPTGTGGLVLSPDLDLSPSRFGGSGVDSLNPFQPTNIRFVWKPAPSICWVFLAWAKAWLLWPKYGGLPEKGASADPTSRSGAERYPFRSITAFWLRLPGKPSAGGDPCGGWYRQHRCGRHPGWGFRNLRAYRPALRPFGAWRIWGQKPPAPCASAWGHTPPRRTLMPPFTP